MICEEFSARRNISFRFGSRFSCIKMKLLVVFLFTVLPTLCFGIKCYQCRGECKDEVKEHECDKQATGCSTQSGTLSGGQHFVEKLCYYGQEASKGGCRDIQGPGGKGTECVCNTDLCNTGNGSGSGNVKSVSLASWVITGLLSLSYLVSSLLS